MSAIPFKQPYQWYAVYVKYKMEKKVCNELTRKEIEVYLPLKKERRQWSDRIKMIEEPLLWGYLFVRVSNKEYDDVLVTKGALRYVCFDGKAAPIPDRQIEDLKIFMQFANESVVVTSERISRGDTVKVCKGPFRDILGEVVEIRGKQRLVLRLGSLGYCVHTELGTNKVEIIKKKTKTAYLILLMLFIPSSANFRFMWPLLLALEDGAITLGINYKALIC